VVTPGYSVQSDYTLRVELEDFSQRFDAPGESRGSLRARVTLLSSHDRKLLAQRVFDIERPAAPNAPGAVKALTEATDAFLEELVKWTAQSTRGRGEQRTVSGKP
jgi:cholesterol transport system auxiliary component